MARRILWASLALAPSALIAGYGFHLGRDRARSCSRPRRSIPLAWLIGEATEHAAEHTGPGVGGFLNASFGNAPELIIALLAIADGLPGVVRGTITGSVVSNILLVLGVAMIAGGEARSTRARCAGSSPRVAAPSSLLLIPSVPGWHGSPNRHSLVVVTIPVAIVLLAVYLWITVKNLRIHHDASAREPARRRVVAAASLASRSAPRRSRPRSSRRSSSTRCTPSARRSG